MFEVEVYKQVHDQKGSSLMRMVIPYHINGKQINKLSADIVEALHTLPRYMMYPTFNYVSGIASWTELEN